MNHKEATSPVRAVIVGCGGIAETHLRAYAGIGDLEIVGLCDLNIEAAQRLSEKFGVGPCFADADEMIDAQKPDIAVVLVPYTAHCAVVERIVEHGVHIICQKPLAGTPEEVDRMIRAADDAGVMLGVNENYRYLRPFVLAKQAIEKGAIGDLLFMRFEEVLYWPEPPPMYQRLEKFYNIEMGPHYFDSMLFLSGKRPIRVHGVVRKFPTIKCKGENYYACTVEFDGGLIARVDDTVALPGRQVRDRVYIYGTRGNICIHGEEGDFAVYDAQAGEWKTRDIGDRPEWWAESFRLPMEAFIAAMRTGAPAPLPASEYKRVMDIVFAVYESARTGRVVELEG